jgi:hypothetical protein
VRKATNAVRSLSPRRRAPARPPRKRGDGDGSTVESQGPWGTLQSFPVFIAAPDWILDMFPLPSATTTWTFRGLTAEEVAAVIDRPGSTHSAVASPAANWLSRWRISESQGAALALTKPPAWVFLHGRRSELSSTMLRQQAERD